MFDYWKLLEWLENYEIVVKFIIYWYVDFWEFVGIFLVILLWKNNYIGLLEIVEIVGKLWNCDISYNLLICGFFRIIGIYFYSFIGEK